LNILLAEMFLEKSINKQTYERFDRMFLEMQDFAFCPNLIKFYPNLSKYYPIYPNLHKIFPNLPKSISHTLLSPASVYLGFI